MLYEVDLNFETQEYRLFLCKPDRTTIAELTEATNRKVTFNYGAINQLSFSIPYKINRDMEMVDNPHIELLRGDYLIRLEYGNEKHWFIITNLNNVSSEGQEYREIQCQGLQYEWKNKLVRLYKGTKKLYDPINQDGVLNDTLLAKTDWKIKYIDGTLLTKWRTFEESQKNLMEFVYDASERYGNVITLVDTDKKEVSFYLDDNLGIDKGLMISDNRHLKSIEMTENFDDVVTRLYVYGKNDLSINAISPTGTDYLDDLSFFMYPYEEDENGNVIKHSYYMSDSLCKALIQYEKLLEIKKGEFQSLLSERESLQQQLTEKENELFVLDTELKQIENQIDAYVAMGWDLTQLNIQKVNKQTQIQAKQNEINGINNQLTANMNQMMILRQEIAIENNFTPEQIVERNRFIRESVWQDNNYTNAEDLLEEGSQKLKRISQPIISYKVDIVDFLQALNTKLDRDRLKIGDIVTIHYPNFGIDIKAKIITIETDIDGKSITLTIANDKDIKSGYLKYKDLLNRAANTSTTVNMQFPKWNLSEENNTELRKLLTESWDANKRAIEAGNNLNYRLDERGLTLKSPDDPLNFLRAVHNVLAITNDGGNTYKNAITYQGVVAERLYGQIIAGENLIIQNEAGTVTIDSNGLTVQDMSLNLIRNDNKTRILLNANDGIKIQARVGSNWEDRLYADTDGVLTVKKIVADTATIKDSQFQNGAIVGSSINIGNGMFTVDSSGFAVAQNLLITGGIFAGNITATGTITGGTLQGANIISNSTIEVTTNLKVGDRIDVGSWNNYTNKYIFLGGVTGLRTAGDALGLFGMAGVIVDYPGLFVNGSLNVNDYPVATQAWVQAWVSANFQPKSP